MDSTVSNKQIYSQLLKFNGQKLVRAIVITAIFAIIVAVMVVIGARMADPTGVYIIGGIVLILFLITSSYFMFVVFARQITCCAYAVNRGELMSDPITQSKVAVISRTKTVFGLFAVYSLVKGITNQISRGINSLVSLGGDNGVIGAVGGIVSLFVGIVLKYFCYCSVGNVIETPNTTTFKGVCDAAVICFKNWKSMLKSCGKIMGLSVLFFILIFGASIALSYFVIKTVAPTLLAATNGETNILGFGIIIVFAIMVFSFIDTLFIKPRFLIIAMRAFFDAKKTTDIDVEATGKIASISPKFRKALAKE